MGETGSEVFTDAPVPLGRLEGRCDNAGEAIVFCRLALYASRDGGERLEVYWILLGEAAIEEDDANVDV